MAFLYRLHLFGTPQEFNEINFVIHNDFRLDAIEKLEISQDSLIVRFKNKVRI